jgi:uncharacterized OsmC-like protein
MTTTATTEKLNGINLPVLHKLLEDVKRDSAQGRTAWGATTRWVGGAVTETEVTGCDIGGKRISRQFKFRTDEPLELGGQNSFANPQEYLMGAFNACMMVGYVALSALFGVELESLEIQCEGEIDLRGFLGISDKVKPGYDEIHYTVRIKGNGTPAQFKEIHDIVTKTSPNRFNISQPIKLKSKLVVE